ncbi:RelA/SpoT domain-containing protein [Coprococcus phoceensis]
MTTKIQKQSNNYTFHRIETYDIIDNIINKAQKECDIMKESTIAKWEIPKYSKSEINKAGKTIADKNSSKKERQDALKVLNNWRSSHAYPLQVIASNLRSKNPDSIVVQRLKRLDSITGKIERFPKMDLYRMQDLGGCRVIVDSIDEVYSAMNQYKSSRIRHILKREYDYIQNPKESGYRSYHMVYQFHSDRKETYNKNMLIEIQFRTKIQHTWATAVEMMGIYTKSNLKSSQGNEDILRFFTLVSSILALKEGTPVCPNTSESADELIKEIKSLDSKHNIVSTLSGLNVAIDFDEKNENKKNNYYILILDYTRKRMRIKSFETKNIEVATEVYNQLEGKLESDKNIVLVSASSFDSLRAAYPNYFTDIQEFVDMMRSLYDNLNKFIN